MVAFRRRRHDEYVKESNVERCALLPIASARNIESGVGHEPRD